jgi:zinc protease
MTHIQFEKFILDNGLRVILHKDTNTPLVTVNLLYNVGARDESPDKTGFAHLFEHLMFGGSKNISSYDTPLQMAGGENNAFTNNDITNYYITLPKSNLETALWLESDRMLELDFSQKNLDIQKSVVIEEYKQRYLNQPYGDVWLLLRPLAYKVHPYQWPTIGKSISHIQDAKLKDVKDFFFTHYAPNNCILTIAGDINTDETAKLVEKWFGAIEKRKAKKRDLPKEPRQKRGRFLEIKRDVPYHAIYKVYHMPDRKSPDYYTGDIMTDILSSGKSSRLYQSLVQQKRLFSEVNAYITGEMDEGLVVFSGKLIDGVKMETAEKALQEEIDKIKDRMVEEKELQKVKNKLEATMVFSLISGLNKAMELSMFELIGDASLINSELEKHQSVTAEKIRDFAIRTLTKENCSSLYYLSNKTN